MKHSKHKTPLKPMQVNHPRHRFETQYEEGKAWCKAQQMRDCFIKSRDGLRLHASFLPAKEAKRFVLLSHGYRGSGFGDFAYMARFLHENHCHLLFIDQRGCGESEGKYITFGAHEQYDVQRWVYYLSAHNPKGLPIYLYGESMGAAAVLMAQAHPLPKEVRGIIADCGFRSMRTQLEYMATTWFHLHAMAPVFAVLDVFCRIFAGFRMRDADTTKAMQVNERPVLFFHGQQDTFVHEQHSHYNYALCKGPKELVIVPGAKHLCSPYHDPKRYRKKIMTFFERYDHEKPSV